MPKLLHKNYEPKNIEKEMYDKWVKNRYFEPEVGVTIEKPDEHFTIVMPPPNITGKLHMGHALDNTLQDILIRWKRMEGIPTLWIPGTDHASISTEMKVVEKLKKEGLTKEMVGREKFLEEVWDWKETYGGLITDQLKKLGCSCDWSKERFTMDEALSDAVLDVFIKLYNKGYIYKGTRMINWCPKCNTSISDVEVEYKEENGKLWYFRYLGEDGSEGIIVATTRPETILGDTAVAVNPNDERYKNMIDKKVILPIVNKAIPIIADDYVEKEFGTGAVKITPAHDPNDYNIGIKHGLDIIKVIDSKGMISDDAPKFQNMNRYEARKAIVKEFEELGLLVKVEELSHNVGTCERCKTVIEPAISSQWFVKMKELAKPAIDVVKNGEIKFVPEKFSKTYFNWMENIQDWCISRQLWWGHRLPAYYCQECGEIIVSKNQPDKCSKCGSTKLNQDEDTLDTWFSSALWPFSTLGWPNETEYMKKFYPTNVLVSGYDIIFFWVARMIFSAIEHTGKIPFDYVLMHGIIRDANGLKMSKSLGNGVDPLDVIEEYGTDALRLGIIISNSPGNDVKYIPEKMESMRNFSNKIWNASRFVLMNMDDNIDFSKVDMTKLTLADRWILSKVNTLTKEVTANMTNFEFGIASQKIYEFFWDEFCDWYIEMVKPRLYDIENVTRLESQYVLNKVLMTALKLLHPYMPYITNEIYMNLIHDDDDIMISRWPKYDETQKFEIEENNMNTIMDIVKNVRNLRAEMNVPISKKAKAIFVIEDNEIAEVLDKEKVYFERLANLDIIIQNNKQNIEDNSITIMVPKVEIFIPFGDFVDIEAECQRLQVEQKNLEKELKRSMGMLSNKGFLDKAPKKVIEEEEKKLANYKEMLEKVKERLEKIK